MDSTILVVVSSCSLMRKSYDDSWLTSVSQIPISNAWNLYCFRNFWIWIVL